MGIPDQDHVLRHVPYKKLLKDADGNVYGLLPQAFELREKDKNKLSVNWVEYFKRDTHDKNVVSAILSLRDSKNRPIKASSTCAYAIGNVKTIKDTCRKHTSEKVDVVFSGYAGNESHSSIIRLPDNHERLKMELAEDVFTEIVKNRDVSSAQP